VNAPEDIQNKDGTTVSYHRECHRAANKAAYQSKNKESEMNQ